VSDTRRNEQCPCGSGLKYKKCHGDDRVGHACSVFANMFFTYLVLPRRLKAGVITQDEHDMLRSKIGTDLVELIVGKDDDKSEVIESEDRKRESVEDRMKDASLTRCPTCKGVVPLGAKCMKCSVEVSNE
jgi:hypothetical protein